MVLDSGLEGTWLTSPMKPGVRPDRRMQKQIPKAPNHFPCCCFSIGWFCPNVITLLILCFSALKLSLVETFHMCDNVTYVWHRHQNCYISKQNMWGHQTCIHLCQHLPSFDNWIKKRLKYKIYIFSLVEIIPLENFFMHGNRNSSVAKNQVINNFDSIPKTLTTCRAYLVLSSVWVTVWVNIVFDQLQPQKSSAEIVWLRPKYEFVVDIDHMTKIWNITKYISGPNINS